MDLNFSSDELAFQQEVKTFLANHLPPHIVEATAKNSSVFVEKDIALQWQAILVKQGWAVPQWPSEHGGTDWTPTQKYLFSRECYLAGAPMLIPLGLLMLAPVIMAFGSEEQKQQHLPKILSGEHYWCQGYSEPGAGSDLASLKLKAIVKSDGDGDDYIVNGSKIWTTHAHLADHGHILAVVDIGPLLLDHFVGKEFHFVEESEVDGLFLQRVEKVAVGEFIGGQQRPELNGFSVFKGQAVLVAFEKDQVVL